jgi:hypothetical protein
MIKSVSDWTQQLVNTHLLGMRVKSPPSWLTLATNGRPKAAVLPQVAMLYTLISPHHCLLQAINFKQATRQLLHNSYYGRAFLGYSHTSVSWRAIARSVGA